MTEEEKRRRLNHAASVVVEATSYQYSRLDYVKDALAAVILMGGIFVMIWIAFALDVMTTGM
jgi:hypothetical protein